MLKNLAELTGTSDKIVKIIVMQIGFIYTENYIRIIVIIAKII